MTRYFQAHKRDRTRLESSVGDCPICRETKPLIQDHCHTTGFNRDRICQRCNNILGRVEYKPEQLDRLLAYVQRWQWEHQHGGQAYKPAKPTQASTEVMAQPELVATAAEPEG